MKILTNPVLLRAAMVFVFGATAFLLGLLSVRLLRKKISEEAEISDAGPTSLETLPLHLYNTVIQQLKQQKHQLQVQSQTEQNRARTSETLSQAVISNLSSGVLVFGANGLVKTANPAAKAILGFASPGGMSAEELFRSAVIRQPSRTTSTDSDSEISIAEEVHIVLREDNTRRDVMAEYEMPSGEKRDIAITISPVAGTDGTLLGVACLITDLSELERIRRQQALQGELSGEMALQLRTSLATIAGYAQQLANNRDPDMAAQLADDIAHEAAQLDRNIGGFLIAKQAPRTSRAGAGN